MNIKAEVIKRYPFESTAVIAKELGITISKVYNIAWAYKIHKDINYLKTAASGRFIEPNVANQYKPGHTPHNKGKQMPEDIYHKVRGTMFKPGHRPMNWKPNGTISYRPEKCGRLYAYIKLSDSKWQLYSRYVYEANYGVIPRGHIVIHIDGNNTNHDISNLKAITMKENMLRNTIHRYPEEIQQLIKLTNKLKNKTNGTKQTK